MHSEFVGEFRRIQKRIARRMYEDGETIYLCPYKMRPGKPWNIEVGVNAEEHGQFDRVIEDFEYNNCGYLGGVYPAYYIRISGKK